MTWTVKRGPAGGGALTSHTLDEAIPDFFVKRLNGVGFFSAVFYNGAVPSRDDLIQFVWDDGGTDQRVHFEGFITDVRRQTERSNFYRARGLSLEGLLWLSTIGAVREWDNEEPWDIWQGTTPDGLLKNSQGNLRPIGSTTVTNGSSSSVPWKVTSGSQGLTMDFRADSAKNWVNIQRLLLQGRHDASNYPSWADAPSDGDGDPYGLEAFVTLETANLDEPRAYLVGRRERSSNHTPETYDTKTDLLKPRRGEEGLTAAQALHVVGGGDGSSRVESGLVGSGGLEGIIADKTIAGTTNAKNQALRLTTLLDPTEEVFTAWLPQHAYSTEVGDRITITDPDEANATLRVFNIGYQISKQSFFLVAGRPRPLPDDPFSSIQNLAGSQAHAPQVTDTQPVSIYDLTRGFAATITEAPGSDVDPGTSDLDVPTGSTFTEIISVTQGTSPPLPSDFGEAWGYLLELQIAFTSHPADSVGSHVHTYQETDSVTISNENSGNAGADPHGHTATVNKSSSNTGGATPSHSQTGPFRIRVTAVWTGTADTNIFWTWTTGRFASPSGFTLNGCYPFALENANLDNDFDIDEIRVEISNEGDNSVDLDADATNFIMIPRDLHRHNASTVIT